MSEANIVINGQPLTNAQAMTLRVAIGSFASEMSHRGALGEDANGEELRHLYCKRAREIEQIFGD